jgi:hypothetical protein
LECKGRETNPFNPKNEIEILLTPCDEKQRYGKITAKLVVSGLQSAHPHKKLISRTLAHTLTFA